MTTKKAFTLIELLIVILILGILAAVAVPQYQKAVEKSKTVQAVTLLKSVYQAAQEYYMANGEWPTSLRDLSVTPNWNGTKSWGPSAEVKDRISNSDWSLTLNSSNSAEGLEIGRLSGKYAGTGFVMWRKYTTSKKVPKDTIVCVERIASGTVFDGEGGDFCQKVMQTAAPVYSNSNLRFYLLP